MKWLPKLLKPFISQRKTVMSESVLIRIRKAIHDGNYDFTDHALEEAENDELTADDILTVLLTGSLDSTYADDPRGTRCVVRGDIVDSEVDVVCRFTGQGRLLIIITVYVVG